MVLVFVYVRKVVGGFMGEVEFDDGVMLQRGVVYCVFCLVTVSDPKPAVTVSNGEACCGDHLSFAKSDAVMFFESEFFRKLREANQ